MNNKPKISNVEWGLVIGALFVIDLIQIGLDLLFEVGVLINRFIDIAVGMILVLYLHLRGQDMTNSKRILGFMATFIMEEIPDVDALPLWGLDGIYNMFLAKSEEKIENVVVKVPGGQMTQKVLLENKQSTPNKKTWNQNNPERLGAKNTLYTPKTNNLNRPKNERGESINNQTTNSKITEEEKIVKSRGNQKPDWMRDKSVDEAMKLRKERLEVAERLGMDKDRSAKTILDLEKEDFERGRNI
jgi:hypothetical protein